jgi:hypothetical protein
MELTEIQRDKIEELLVDQIIEVQSCDRYWFDQDQITLLWVVDEEMFYALKPNQTWDYYSPRDIECFVASLSDLELKRWFCEDFSGCELEDFEEYINDELEAA